MMEKVRAAAFNMLQSRCGDMVRLPGESMWLDLFAGKHDGASYALKVNKDRQTWSTKYSEDLPYPYPAPEK